MLLVFLTVSCVFCGLCVGDGDFVRTECFGGRFMFPKSWTPPWYKGLLSFTPSKGGPSRLMMDRGEAIHPRVRVSFASITLRDLREEDEGDYYVSFGGEQKFKIATLKILSCAEEFRWHYGATYSYNIPTSVDFMEFTPVHGLEQPKVLWNRTNPEVDAGGRVTVKRNVLKISALTQKDNGFYNFRERSNHLVSRLHFVVEELNRKLVYKKDEDLFVRHPFPSKTWDVTFTPEGKSSNETIIQGGQIVKDDWFGGRLSVKTEGIEISSAESKDSGTFYFRDPEGNLAMRVNVEVEKGFAMAYIAIATLIFILVIVCCCGYCCKKKKKAASPSVVYLRQTQLEDASYSAAPSSSSPFSVPKKTTASSLYPQVAPQVAPPGAQRPAPFSSGALSSDGEPRFELKGVTELPLSSGSTVCDVYTSDKLNVL